jgi:uncharacterized protein with PQ loop repeat
MVAAAGTMELEILGINFGCVLAALADAKIPEKDCLLPLASKLLGYAIVAASTTVKLPQILKILKHGSVRGLSVASFELEVVGYTIALAYCIHKGLPFSAYGELAFLLIQAIILVAIIYYYSPPMGTKTWMKALLYPSVYLFIFNYSLGADNNDALILMETSKRSTECYENLSTSDLLFLNSACLDIADWLQQYWVGKLTLLFLKSSMLLSMLSSSLLGFHRYGRIL